MYDILIIGGGPAGVICAIEASKRKKKVAIVDKNHILLRKFRLTGNGRSNILNYCDIQELIDQVHNGRFLYSALQNCNPQFLYQYFEKMGIELKIEDHNRVYPKNEDANLVAETLIANLKNVDIYYNEKVENIKNEFDVYTTNHHLKAKKIVIATGGMSYPVTGSNGDGYQFGKLFNHTIKDLYPVETPIISNAKFIQDKILQGITLQDVKLTVLSNNKKIKEYTHDLLFTHFGISGPLSLGVSEDVYLQKQKKKDVFVQLDLFPNLNHDELKLKIKSLINQNPGLSIKNSLKSLTQSRLLQFYFEEVKLDQNLVASKISNKQLDDLITILKKFTFPVHDVKPIPYAFVTGGGINIKEINPNTFESKLQKNLYFIGEILDIHGKIGGYNLTTCFLEGYTLGNLI